MSYGIAFMMMTPEERQTELTRLRHNASLASTVQAASAYFDETQAAEAQAREALRKARKNSN